MRRAVSLRLLHFAGAFLLAAFAVGCTQEYQRPAIEELTSGQRTANVAPFPGLSGLLSADSPGKILWTHGICPHDFSWVRDRAGLLASELGATADVPAEPAAPTSEYSIDVPIRARAGNLDARFLVWSPEIKRYRNNLAFDKARGEPGGEFPWKRAKLNGELKSMLMDQCLVDAVVYSGPNGRPIRMATKKAVCEVLGGRWMPRDSMCDFAESAAPEKVAFVTESMGSKILFDAIRAIWNDAAREGPAATAEAAHRLSRVVGIYMAANQIPLLDQADATSAGEEIPAIAGRRHPMLDLFGRARDVERGRRALAALPPLVLVAFTDPNDLLSYRLIGEGIGISDIRLIDVIVSNDWTYFGYVERPDTAHCGYKENLTVMRLVIHGYAGGELPDPGATNADNACLNG